MEEMHGVRYGKAQHPLPPPASSPASSFWVFFEVSPTMPLKKKKKKPFIKSLDIGNIFTSVSSASLEVRRVFF